MLCDALQFSFLFHHSISRRYLEFSSATNSSTAVSCGLLLLHAVFKSRVSSSLNFHFKECKTSVGTAREHSCLSGSGLRKFFAYCIAAIGKSYKRQDRKSCDIRLGGSSIGSRAQNCYDHEKSDDNLHGCACTDFIACGSCSRSTEELCQSAATSVDTCVVRVAKQQQEQQQQSSSSKAAAAKQQQQSSSSKAAAAKQQQQQSSSSSKAAAKQQQSSSKAAAAKQQQQQSSSSSKAAAAKQQQQSSSSKAAAAAAAKQLQRSNSDEAAATKQQRSSSSEAAAAKQQQRSSSSEEAPVIKQQ